MAKVINGSGANSFYHSQTWGFDTHHGGWVRMNVMYDIVMLNASGQEVRLTKTEVGMLKALATKIEEVIEEC